MPLANTPQGSKFFVNLQSVQVNVDTFDSTGALVSPTGFPAAAQTIGQLVVRDMGKTVRVPGGSNGNNTTQRILRKVQRIDSNASTDASWPVTNGFVGFNAGVGGAADSGSGNNPTGFHTFYIDVGGATTGTVKWASLAM